MKHGPYSVIRMKADEPFSVSGKPIQLFLKDEELLQKLTVVDVKDKFDGVYTSGTYAFWNALVILMKELSDIYSTYANIV